MHLPQVSTTTYKTITIWSLATNSLLILNNRNCHFGLPMFNNAQVVQAPSS